jgi:16S rRNA (cytosine967-C5)-methyltransferase
VKDSVQLNNASTAKRTRASGVSPARLAAYHNLKRVEEESAYASVLLASETRLSERDRALTYELTMGVLRNQLLLDRLIAHYANRDPERLDPEVIRILRLSLYQLRFLTRIPASAAVNEAVKLVRFVRIRSADKFVNAVLRRAVREPDHDVLSVIDGAVERLAVETSHPQWLLERWIASFGFEHASAFARANNETPFVSFRLTGAPEDDKETLQRLKAAGALVPSSVARNAWRTDGGVNVVRQLAREGRIYIQDEASQLVSQILTPKPGEFVLDLCAAPGSKTTHLASLAADRATVVAGDMHEHRIRVVKEAAQRQKLSSVQCVILDGQKLPFAYESFHSVLVDAPCSGTGTLRRNPEIRWRISPTDIEDLSDLQKRLLHNAATAVKPGGRLVYSTCSVESEENEAVVEHFLERNGQFSRVEPPIDASLLTATGAVRTWPHQLGTDGFFIATLERAV